VDYFVLMPEERGALFFDEPGRAPVVEEDTDIRNQMMTARLVWQPRYVSPNLLHRLHRVTAPTLVVWGQNDRFLSLAHGEALARGVGNGRLEIVVDSGHFPATEQPDITARLIIDFARE
jgi:pimeloyl-ACP methyl ester carboxylesterase